MDLVEILQLKKKAKRKKQPPSPRASPLSRHDAKRAIKQSKDWRSDKFSTLTPRKATDGENVLQVIETTSLNRDKKHSSAQSSLAFLEVRMLPYNGGCKDNTTRGETLAGLNRVSPPQKKGMSFDSFQLACVTPWGLFERLITCRVDSTNRTVLKIK